MQRNIVEARRAFSFTEDADVDDSGGRNEDLARQLSRAAHGALSAKPHASSQSALASAGWSEGGHNEELTHRGAALLLRGGVDGIMLSMSVLSLGNGLEWASSETISLSLALVCCWAVFSGCREGLDSITYRSHYRRERSREAWGIMPTPRLHL